MFDNPVIREAIVNEVRRERERRFHAIARIRRPRRPERAPGGAASEPAAVPAAIPRTARGVTISIGD